MISKSLPVILIFYLFLIQIAFGQQSRDTLHNIAFVATDDNQIGSFLENVTLRDIRSWGRDINRYSSLTVVNHFFTGQDFTLPNLEHFIDTFKADPKDPILFWFVGHGIKDDEKATPNVILLPNGTTNSTTMEEIRANSINLKDIYNRISPESEFLWFIGDACNADPIDPSALRARNTIKSLGTIKKRDDAQLNINYDDLFLDRKERHFFYGIKKGKLTYASDAQGSLYVRAFLRTVDKELQNTGIPDTEHFENLVKREYEVLWDEAVKAIEASNDENDAPLKRPGFFKRIVNYLFAGKAVRKARKKYKQVLKSGNLDELGTIIPRAKENGEEPKELTSFLKDRPTTYYMTMGIFEEFNATDRADSTFVAECFCTANEVIGKSLSTDKEFRLLGKIEDYNKENGDILGLAAAGGRKKWLRKKCEEYKKYLANELSVEEEELEQKKELAQAKEKEIEDLKRQRIAKRQEIETAQKKHAENLLTIKETNEEWEGENYEISYTITKPLTGAIDKECLKSTVDKLGNGEELTEDCEKIYASFIKVERKRNDGKEVNAYRKARASGFSLGKWCNDDIIQTTSIYLDPLVEAITKVPQDYRSRLKVKLQITGFADASPCRGAGCRFKGLETMTYTYKNKDGQTKSFATKKGVVDFITNEQLAFARAICAQSEAKNILNDNGVLDITYEFIAEVKEEKGDNDRGVALSFILENQFLHYKEKVDGLTEANEEIIEELDERTNELAAIEDRLADAEEELVQINETILQTEENIYQIEEDLQKLSEGGVQKNLVKVLRARGKTRAEALEYLGY